METKAVNQCEQSAIAFLNRLAELASAPGVLDENWWMALKEMLQEGWFAGHGAFQGLPPLDEFDMLRLAVALEDAGVIPRMEAGGVLVTVESMRRLEAKGIRFTVPPKED